MTVPTRTHNTSCGDLGRLQAPYWSSALQQSQLFSTVAAELPKSRSPRPGLLPRENARPSIVNARGPDFLPTVWLLTNTIACTRKVQLSLRTLGRAIPQRAVYNVTTKTILYIATWGYSKQLRLRSHPPQRRICLFKATGEKTYDIHGRTCEPLDELGLSGIRRAWSWVKAGRVSSTQRFGMDSSLFIVPLGLIPKNQAIFTS